jgi:hypothetical protein
MGGPDISLNLLRELKSIFPDHILIPLPAILDIALLCFIIHPYDAEALHVAPGPFEIIEQ